jgi:phosphopantothenoylcysteine decarboxylase/phosphopantothenate--cysteine ligase
MSLLSGKKVLIGVTGGIAAYKSALLVRQFIKYGAEVKVVMTPSAKDFVTPLTLSTLSKNEVFSSFYNEDDENAKWNNHVDLGLWADLMVIAPATANTLSKMASGTSDNLLLATYLSAKCPIYFAPAMDLDMYKHPSSLNSFKTLQSFGNIMIPAGSGELASGLHGEGRMAEPEEVATFIEQHLTASTPLLNKKVIITAGPTYEAIDPVRFIGNHSSGKMGYELAKQAAKQGAKVILVSGPSSLNISDESVTLIRVNTAQQMYDAVHNYYDSVHVGIAAAAVSDYRPKVVADQKIKKAGEEMTIVLEKSPDILRSMGQKKKNQLLVGFALETENEIANAKKKLEKKNLDFIVLNSLNDKGAGFKKGTNKITIIDKAHNSKSFDLKSKAEVAKDIINEVIAKLNA